MATANTADFFGGGSAPLPKAAVKAPKTNAAADAKARANIAATKTKIAKDQRNTANAQYLAGRARDLKAREAEIARLMADPGPEGQEYRARRKFISSAGVDWGLIPMGAKVIGTGAAVIASGGAVAGVLGATAAGSAVAGATLLSKGIDALDTAQTVVGAVKRGDVASVAGVAATKGGDVINLKTNVKLPSIGVAKPIAATAKAAASKTKAAVKAVQKTSAAKVKVPTASAVVKAVAGAKPAAKPPTIFSGAKPISAAEAAKQKGAANIAHLNATKPKPAAKPAATSAAFAAAAALASVKPKPLTASKPPAQVKLAVPKPPAQVKLAPVASSAPASSAPASSAAVPTVKAGATSLPKGARGFFVPVAGAQKGVAVFVGA